MMKINGEEITDRSEIWSVKMTSTDGVESEIACPEGETEARLLQLSFGGRLWKRAMYVTEGEEVQPISLPELQDMV